ncbi:MAG: hypothetical protein Q8M92_01505 [Candidatus Subteraquimicrobiales bacterium]|nr:hypothetical protein [Candidatus Subteraquimicrobiales bacterium]
MRPMVIFGIRIEKELFGTCSKSAMDSSGARMADLVPYSSATDGEQVNIHGPGFFEPYDYLHLWNKDIDNLVIILEADKYCYNVMLGDIVKIGIQDERVEHAIVFGYQLPSNHEEIDLQIHEEHGQFIFHVADGIKRKVIKLAPLAVFVPKNNQRLFCKYITR